MAPLPAPYRQESVDVTANVNDVNGHDHDITLSPASPQSTRSFSRNPQRSGTNDTTRSTTRSAHGGGGRSRSLKRVLTSLFTPDKKINHPAIPGTLQSIRNVILSSWLNILLVFIPVSWVLHFVIPDNSVAVFVTSFIAIIPLAALLGESFPSKSRLGCRRRATRSDARDLTDPFVSCLSCS